MSGSIRKEQSLIDNVLHNRRLLTFVMVLFLIFIMGGGIYDLLNNPGSAVATSGGGYSYVAGSGEQTIIESMVSMLFYGFGFSGLYLSMKSSQVLYDKSKSKMYLLVGLILTSIAFLGLTLLSRIKR